jgi:two-component system phosphate regulon response regulator OmpR
MSKPSSHILVVDDDPRILDLLERFLLKNNFLVSKALSAGDAQKLMKKFCFDLIILDVMLPEVTGIEFASALKSSDDPVPILMLTALSSPDDKVAGLEAGASDYVTKPFDPKELLLRINNIINLNNKHKEEKTLVRFGNNKYDFTSKKLYVHDDIVNLSEREQKLLEILLKAAGLEISRDELSKKFDGMQERSVDVLVTRLRNKLESDPKSPKYLKTVRGKGYALYT